MNIDETGFKENGKKLWIWVFKAAQTALFKVADSRGSKVLVETLGEDYEGIVGSDFYGAYRKFIKDAGGIDIQFCLAHLIRELRFFKEKGGRGAVRYANRLLEILKKVFAVYHNRGSTSESAYRRRMNRLKEEFLRIGSTSGAKGVGAMVKRLMKYGENYFVFLENSGIEPTNNQAERSIRHVVIDRKVTQGVRGVAGRRWCERIWSVRASCRLQGRSCFEFLHESIRAHISGNPAPSACASHADRSLLSL